MSFLKQAYALEQEVLEDVVEPTGEEFVEVDAETEATRQEAEAMGEELDRAVAVHNELENQNDTVREILEQDGEITPATAAVLEVARRTAAAGLGLDPDEEGKELVDAAGLESLVATKSVVALEEAEKASNSLWEKIKALWNAFVAKVGEFWNWLTKLLDFTSNKNKALANKLKAVDKEAFEKALGVLNERLKTEGLTINQKDEDGNFTNSIHFKKSDFAAFDKTGKVININGVVSKTLAALDTINKNFDSSVEKAKKDLQVKYKEVASKQDVEDTFDKQIVSNFKEVQINVLNNTYSVYPTSYSLRLFERASIVEIPHALRFSKEDLVAALLETDKICKEMRKFSEQAFKRYKTEKDKAEKTKANAQSYAESSIYRTILISRKTIFKVENKISRQLTRVMKSYTRIAQEIVNSTGSEKQEEK